MASIGKHSPLFARSLAEYWVPIPCTPSMCMLHYTYLCLKLTSCTAGRVDLVFQPDGKFAVERAFEWIWL
jgi:hypothetical protein